MAAMNPSTAKLRRRIAWEAASLIFERRETQYQQARMAAARRLTTGPIHADVLPTRRQIRDALRMIAFGARPEVDARRLYQLRLAALDLMLRLRRFRPRLIGRVLTGSGLAEATIQIQVFHDAVEPVWQALAADATRLRRPRPSDNGPSPLLAVIELNQASSPAEVAVYPSRLSRATWRNRRTGRRMPRANITELRELVEWEHPDRPLHAALLPPSRQEDRFEVYRTLLTPLEQVREHPSDHPEGDALYHSLQVFELAKDQLPYDEEFLLAALLHDVGKAIDRRDPVTAGLKALEGHITERTRWLIENQPAAQAIRQGTIGVRAHRRLQATEDFDELMLLYQCERKGRQVGVRTADVDDALSYIRDLAGMCEEGLELG